MLGVRLKISLSQRPETSGISTLTNDRTHEAVGDNKVGLAEGVYHPYDEWDARHRRK